MADFTLNAPGTTNNPWTPAGVLTPLGSTVGIKSDATGWRSISSSAGAVFAHNVAYGTTITVTCTIAAGASSNGDQLFIGATVRSGANAGGGVGIFLDAFALAGGWWDVTGTTFTKITSADTSITRTNGDVWSVTLTQSGGSWAISNVTQNGTTRALTGTTTTTQYGSETTAAAGASYLFGNNDSLYLGQFTGTGVAAGTFTLTAAAGTYAMTGQAASLFQSYILSAAGGTYAITGQAATLSPSGGSFTLVAAAGVYNLIGAPSSSAFQIDAATGAYVLTGQAAVLSPTGIFTLAAGFGSYSFTGQAATFTTGTSVAYNLVAATGFYSLAGIAATLLVSSIIPVVPACVTNFEIISDAYQLIGVIDENSSPSNEQGITGLSVLNDYLLNEAADGMRLGWFRQSVLQACAPLKDEDIYGVKVLLALQLAARYGITVQNQQLLEAGITAKTQLVKRSLRYSEADFSEFPRPQGGPWGGPNWI